MSNESFMEAFEEEAGKPASTNSLLSASQIVEEMVSVTKIKEGLEEQLKKVNSHLNFLKTVKVPEILSLANQSDFTVAEGENKGWKVKVDDFVSGSLPKDSEAKEKAISLLEQYQASDLIKSQVFISFGRGEDMKATDLVNELIENGYDVTHEKTVHAQTLMAFGRERLKRGMDIDGETLGLHIGRAAKLTPPKTKALNKAEF